MMEDYILFLSGVVVSCLVMTIVIFQFMERRHKRVYQNKYLYLGIKIATSIILMIVNLFEHPIANIVSWIVVFGLASYYLYDDNDYKPVQRVMEAEVMILVFAVCEAIGVILLDFIFWKMNITLVNPAIKNFLNMIFSMLVLLFLYYFFILRIWGRRIKFTKTQYILHVIIALYSFINMLVVIEAVEKISEGEARLILLLSMGFIVFADMYFLYFVQFIEESNQLKLKVTLMEQQAAIQFKHYSLQSEKYNESLRIVHDVKKHTQVIEDLYRSNQGETAMTYTKEINTMLKPLALQELSSHPIFNILLNDKLEYAIKQKIDVQLDIEPVDWKFMEPMDITTIFGNLLDNALEECEQVPDYKYIKLKIFSYHDMVGIKIENSMKNDIIWKKGKPVSKKGPNHGIGLINVEAALEKYDGSIQLSSKDGMFQCSISINR